MTSSRAIGGLAGDLAATQDQAGTLALQLANLRGDVVATVDDSPIATGTTSYAETTEYGQARDPADAYSDYGWLGGQQRSANALGGIVLMGVRLYNPATGRFLSIDPMAGGSANSYDYCNANPVSYRDVDGRSPKLTKQKILQYVRTHIAGLLQLAWAVFGLGGLIEAAHMYGEVKKVVSRGGTVSEILGELNRSKWGRVLTVAFLAMAGVVVILQNYCGRVSRNCYFAHSGGQNHGSGQGGFGGAGRPWLPTSR